ncbi:restriction endonuclease subunit S [Shewanella sp. Shew256]|uniref:restriction endonuclease subunit S n=1 Tax=Shewanella sp. Shew256 TaxID=1969376 RepID=UPI000B49A1EF|nr:restriction endonuclease subunit S [Shewanella sp. Shew256]
MPVSSLPSLRFFDFTDKWSESDLQEVSAKNISYGIVQTGEYVDDGVPCIRVMDLTKEKINTNELIKTSVEISQSYKKTILEKDELMIALRGEIGLTKLVNSELEGCNLTRGIARVSPKLDIIDPRFLELYLNSESSRVIFDKRKNGSALKEIPISELKKIPVRYPKLSEQQKIADFLTAVDSKISQLTEKHRLLNEYKKGAMQQLFSQQLRFKDKDGNAFPDWDEKSIGDIMSESRVKGSGGDIAKKLTVKIWGKGVIPKNDDGRGSENTQYYKRKAGQFIYGKLDFLNCAFAIIPDDLDGYESTLDLPSFDVSSSVNRYFILELVKQKKFYKRFGEIADGSRKAKRINVNVFQAMPIIIPSKEEQDRIMAFLGALDQKVAAVAEQIEQTKQFKKGLLQQMFV